MSAPCCMSAAHGQDCACRRDSRSFPGAADGRPPMPMAAELWAAGCDLDTAQFAARQLAFAGIAMIRRNGDGTVTYIGAEDWAMTPTPQDRKATPNENG